MSNCLFPPTRVVGRRSFRTPATSHRPTIASRRLVELRGGGDNEVAFNAYEWCVNLGAPAALVAGAVLATLYESVRGGALEVREGDGRYARLAKKVTTLLLLSAFALQIASIFVTTVTGTVLLSRDWTDVPTEAAAPLALLREQYEFEYLTSRLSFLQGLINWLAGVALDFTIPSEGASETARRMNAFGAALMLTLIVLLISFYNAHMTFYRNYYEMLSRWAVVFTQRFFLGWRERPLFWLYVPAMIGSLYLGIAALTLEKGQLLSCSALFGGREGLVTTLGRFHGRDDNANHKKLD